MNGAAAAREGKGPGCTSRLGNAAPTARPWGGEGYQALQGMVETERLSKLWGGRQDLPNKQKKCMKKYSSELKEVIVKSETGAARNVVISNKKMQFSKS